MRTTILVAALAALAGPAFADTSWTATPAQPSTATGFVAADLVWNCDASGCRSGSDASDADPMTNCKALAQKVGSLTGFAAPKPFAPERLQKCNAAAAKPAKP